MPFSVNINLKIIKCIECIALFVLAFTVIWLGFQSNVTHRVRTLFQKRFSRLFQASESFSTTHNAQTSIFSCCILSLGCSVFQENLIAWVYRFPGLPTIFKAFPVLENTRLTFKCFPGFPGLLRTLNTVSAISLKNKISVIAPVFRIYQILVNDFVPEQMWEQTTLRRKQTPRFEKQWLLSCL